MREIRQVRRIGGCEKLGKEIFEAALSELCILSVGG